MGKDKRVNQWQALYKAGCKVFSAIADEIAALAEALAIMRAEMGSEKFDAMLARCTHIPKGPQELEFHHTLQARVMEIKKTREKEKKPCKEQLELWKS